MEQQKLIPKGFVEQVFDKQRRGTFDIAWFRNDIAKKLPNEEKRQEMEIALYALPVMDDASQRGQVERWISQGFLPAEAMSVFEKGRLNTGWYRDWVRDNVKWHVDHDPSLAQHWHQTGYNSIESDRIRAAEALEHLTVMEAGFNLSKGSIVVLDPQSAGVKYEYTEKPWVGPEFTSRLAALGAKTIDGQPFLDKANGDPIK
jgi:hypothetical protein